jgi:hypothetical protein
MCKPFGFISSKTLNYLDFQSFDFELNYLMEVILSVPDGGYFERT